MESCFGAGAVEIEYFFVASEFEIYFQDRQEVEG